ncbi:GAF and ANTAR domain-containing protein [Salinibacterium sp. SWN167]|nr:MULTISPECIES: GAF and ANTAR domain-containing protein [unclassified Salinibacterium]MBH0054287.1 GAF and ANTAR domain-containing protein [Salinibacterium sp. SWN139]MBH0083573.1 GAF and ANTAR domain-containing protein [Salinibacterium sp. SWN167]
MAISVIDEYGNQLTVCVNGRLAARLDALQFELGEGPARQALSSRSPVLWPDLDQDSETGWPVFQNAARELGVRGVFSFPLVLGNAVVGAVNLSTTTPHEADADFVSNAQSMANNVALTAVERALHAAQRHSSPETEQAPALRREVHQATGIIISQLGLSAPDAFARLQAHAFSTGRPVDDVARDLVTRVLEFDPVTE